MVLGKTSVTTLSSRNYTACPSVAEFAHFRLVGPLSAVSVFHVSSSADSIFEMTRSTSYALILATISYTVAVPLSQRDGPFCGLVDWLS